jgi:hypothetical protein
LPMRRPHRHHHRPWNGPAARVAIEVRYIGTPRWPSVPYRERRCMRTAGALSRRRAVTSWAESDPGKSRVASVASAAVQPAPAHFASTYSTK